MTTEGGLLLVDKALDSSSHDVVLAARRALRIKRIGHTGTLDPFATGLLLVLLGSLTRLAEFFHVLPKTYLATMSLGRETDTDDLTGETTTESETWREVDAERVRLALASQLGSRLQVPSTFSAKRIQGQRAYRLARAGQAVDLTSKPITVHDVRLDLLEGRTVRFETSVSTGTYVRALARDVGRDLGCGAHLVELRRTAIGPFDVTDAVGSDQISLEAMTSAAAFKSGSEAVPWLPRRDLESEEVTAVRQGRAIECGEVVAPAWSEWGATAESNDLVALTDDVGLVAIARRQGDALCPRKVFAA